MPKVVLMKTSRTLRQIIMEDGSTALSRRLRHNQSYLSKVALGKTPGSVGLLGRALGAYGPALDLEASLRELVPEDVAMGEEVDHEQP